MRLTGRRGLPPSWQNNSFWKLKISDARALRGGLRGHPSPSLDLGVRSPGLCATEAHTTIRDHRTWRSAGATLSHLTTSLSAQSTSSRTSDGAVFRSFGMLKTWVSKARGGELRISRFTMAGAQLTTSNGERCPTSGTATAARTQRQRTHVRRKQITNQNTRQRAECVMSPLALQGGWNHVRASASERST